MLKRTHFDFSSPAVWAVGIGVPLIVALLAPSLSKDGIPPRPDNTLTYGRQEQLVAVVVAAEFCAGSRDTTVRGAIVRALKELQLLAESRGERFVSVGVSVDPSATQGVKFLADLYPFSEIAAGNNWTGTGALTYLWEGFPGRASVPQILVMHRAIVVDTAGSMSIHAKDAEVVRRFVGRDDILGFDPAVVNDMLRERDSATLLRSRADRSHPALPPGS